MRNPNNQLKQVKKLKVAETTLFAMRNIPAADVSTLKQFLLLINAGGSFGTVSHEQIIKKMHQVVKYIPSACIRSMLIVADLLEIEPSGPLCLNSPQTAWYQVDADKETVTFFYEPEAVGAGHSF